MILSLFLCILVLLLLVTFSWERRLPGDITPLLVLLSISFPKIADHTLGVAPYDLYDITDMKRYGFFNLLLYGVYPAFGYLFIYLYDWLKPRKLAPILYFVVWSLFAVGFEYLLVRIRVFSYHGWHLIYPLPVYLLAMSSLLLFYKGLCWYRQNKTGKNREMVTEE
ncbi:hypothetical protein [Ectobacillus ponti]|uniref:Uncharacterized protein n=1 Tax=Ectobacillus ponti TaxID=2961894 RepID=A0AA41X6Y2_9BACI|nr:hypothetical protein [Ectobacillus ponti]MCP8970064.1 hypothetical protein [Ectobacillus ponti]